MREAVDNPPAGAARPAWAEADPLMRAYYDDEWGVPVTDERGLFEALSLELFQSGLAWATILRKREAFRAAFGDFQPDVVAAFTAADVARLMNDAGIVRNRRKILATIQNAGATVRLRDGEGLARFVWSFAPVAGAPAAGAPTAGAPTAGAKPAARSSEPPEPVSRTPESEALAKGLRARGFTFVGPTTMYALMQAVGVVDGKRA